MANRSEGLGARLAQVLSIKVRDWGGPGWPGPVDKSEGLGGQAGPGPIDKSEGFGGPGWALSINVKGFGGLGRPRACR